VEIAMTLDKRIAGAFNGGAASADFAPLIKEVEAAVVSAESRAQNARARALDPALSAADATAARREMEDASFQRDRYQEAVTRLDERHREVKADEEQACQQLAYDAAMVERDKLAKELAQTYPALAAQLAQLMSRIDANDHTIERINRKALPLRMESLVGAELIARDLRSFLDGAHNIPRLTEQLRLPAFKYDDTHNPYTWPRPGRSTC
jgi:hypothetical protein